MRFPSYDITTVTRRFVVHIKLAEPEPIIRGKYINRWVRTQGERGYWLPAVFVRADVHGYWPVSTDAKPTVHLDAQGWAVRKDGRRGQDFQRTFRNTERDHYDPDSKTPIWALTIMAHVMTLASGWEGWPFTTAQFLVELVNREPAELVAS